MEGVTLGNLWQVTEESFNPHLKTVHSQETVFNIGNGYFCTRGTFEEGFPQATPSTLLWGVFDHVPIAKEELANTPDWTVLQLYIGGERFRLDRGTVLDYHRTLDIQNGVVSRSVHWQSPSGARVHIVTERFASLADEHVGIIRYSVTADQQNQQEIKTELRGDVDTAQGNYNVMHWRTVDQAHEQDLLWLHSETLKTHVQLAQTISFAADNKDFEKEFIDSDVAPSIRFYGDLQPGATLTTEKVVVFYTSRDNVEPLSTARSHHEKLLASAKGASLYETLLKEQKQAWQEYWQQADIVLEGDDKAQIGLRYSLYQLRISTNYHDDRYSIAAKGLTGFGYRGHVFHDTEIFMLPYFTYVFPEVARNLLLYRYRLLPAARKKAAAAHNQGARFPWESTLDGEETTPSSIVHPETGEVVPVLNGLIELHITSSIAHATYEYWRVTGDDDFMHDYGTQLLLETAIYWDSRAEAHEGSGEYTISDVIGPDEWHEHVNNNAHTNYMAKHNLRKALDAFKWLQETDSGKAHDLAEELGLDDARLAHIRDVAEHLRFPQDPQTKLIDQFDGFLQRKKFDFDKYRGRKESFQGILGMEDIQKYQLVKQADTLMLLTLLDEEFDRETKSVNWDYYFPITDHDYGSSLTPALHVILASELGHVDQVYELFMKGALVDIENLRGNTPEGIHNACCGAVWQAVILGCAGLRITENGYTTNPVWPESWTRIAFNFQHKGETVHVDLHR